MATAAIAGLGLTELGKVYGRTPRRLAAEAVRLAAADAGLAPGDLDGLLVCPGIAGPALDVGLAQALGLRDLRLLSVVNAYGASAGAAVQLAALAIISGSASAVACVFADTPLRARTPAGATFSLRAGSGQAAPVLKFFIKESVMCGQPRPRSSLLGGSKATIKGPVRLPN